MNQKEHAEIHEISLRLDRMVGWMRIVVGAILTVIASVVAWEVKQAVTLGQVTEVASRNASDIAAISADVRRSGREISGMSEQIKAQGRVLERMEGNLAELTRYLRERTPR